MSCDVLSLQLSVRATFCPCNILSLQPFVHATFFLQPFVRDILSATICPRHFVLQRFVLRHFVHATFCPQHFVRDILSCDILSGHPLNNVAVIVFIIYFLLVPDLTRKPHINYYKNSLRYFR
jgi:hypothetical protein